MPNRPVSIICIALAAAWLFCTYPTAATAGFKSELGSKDSGWWMEYAVSGAWVDKASHHGEPGTQHVYSGMISSTKISVTGRIRFHTQPEIWSKCAAGVKIYISGVETAWAWPPEGQDGELHNAPGNMVDLPFAITAEVPAGCRSAWISGYITVGRGENPSSIGFMINLPSAVIPPPCKESADFFDLADLGGYYNGQRSLVYSSDELAQQLVNAYARYKNNHPVTYGASPRDAVEMAARFSVAAMPSEHVPALQAAAAAIAKKGKLSPGQLFEIALQVCNGNVRHALVACHSALYRDKSGVNSQFVTQNLLRLRDPAGYCDRALKYTTGAGVERDINPRQHIAVDEQGVWYHFFGMATVEFADESNIIPFEAARAGAEIWLAKEYTEKVRQKGFPITGLGGLLADYAVALEDAIRTSPSQGKPPDPDKYCINYAGIAAGRALREQFSKASKMPKQPVFSADPSIAGYQTANSDGSLHMQCPVSVKVQGTGGEWFSFDQQQKIFDGNTPYVIFEVIPEPDESWGMFITPLFHIASIEFTAVGNGSVAVTTYDKASGATATYQTTVQTGQQLALASFSSPLVTNGNALTPIAASGPKPSSADQPPATEAKPTWQVPTPTNGTQIGQAIWPGYDFGEVVISLPPDWTIQQGNNDNFITFFSGDTSVALTMMHANYSQDDYLKEVKADVEWHREANIGGRDALVTQFLINNGVNRNWIVTFKQPLSDGATLHMVLTAGAGNWANVAQTVQSIVAVVRFK